MKRKGISKALRARVILAWHGRCAKCCHKFEAGERIDLDHIHQLATGGADDESNLRPLHPWCHAIKTREDAKVRGKIRRLSGQNKPRVKKRIPAHINGIPSRPFRRPAAQQTGER